jgi:1-acyl-sn-glycerol-3-phosphate acyltransferase
LAIDTNHAIIPAVIFNTKKALSSNYFFYLLPKKLSIHFLPAIEPDNLTVDELKQKVFDTMRAYYTENNN